MEEGDKLYVAAQKAVLGDEAAFVEVCDCLKLQLFKTAFGILMNESLAYEAVDETVYKAFKNIKKLKQPQYVKTWFVKIVINVCHDMYRKREKEVIYISEEYEPYEIVSGGYGRIEIKELMNALPEDLKRIISMKYFSDFTLSEIAGILKIPVGTVKSKLNRALKLLRLEAEK